jgi:hypothetical protein
MATGIPLPGNMIDTLMNGVKTGSNMYTGIMNPILHREQQKQLDEHFKQELELKKQAAARAGANSGLHRQILQQQLLGLTHKNDPMYELNQFKALQEQLVKDQGIAHNAESQPIPAQESGQGMGMFSPEGLQQAQQEPTQASVPNVSNANFDALKQNPLLRGFFKHKFGFDPLGGESNVLHGPARDAADLAKLKKEAGENSEVYQNAKAQYDAQLDAKKDLRDIRARTQAGLKSGEKEFFDSNTGAPLGKEIPLTAKERESEEGNILFNELYPYVYKGASPFSGEGSISRLQNAAANYKNDPQARKLFDDFLLSEKMLAATTVNEASTLKSGHTNQTYKMLKESLDAQDVPKKIKSLIKQFEIPASASLKASMRYQQILSDARKKARRGTPATQKLFYNPELQAQHDAQSLSNENAPAAKEEVKAINGKSYKKINGEWHEIH